MNEFQHYVDAALAAREAARIEQERIKVERRAELLQWAGEVLERWGLTEFVNRLSPQYGRAMVSGWHNGRQVTFPSEILICRPTAILWEVYRYDGEQKVLTVVPEHNWRFDWRNPVDDGQIGEFLISLQERILSL